MSVHAFFAFLFSSSLSPLSCCRSVIRVLEAGLIVVAFGNISAAMMHEGSEDGDWTLPHGAEMDETGFQDCMQIAMGFILLVLLFLVLLTVSPSICGPAGFGTWDLEAGRHSRTNFGTKDSILNTLSFRHFPICLPDFLPFTTLQTSKSSISEGHTQASDVNGTQPRATAG